MTGAVYDAAFYADQGDESLASARIVFPLILAALNPARIVDIGCGVGTWLAAAAECGIADTLGVDGNYVDRAALRIPPNRFLPADLAEPGLPRRIAEHHPAGFDLALCLEVAEHLPHARASGFIAELCALADVVVFSAALPFQYGTDHINEQWPEFWAILFRANGFRCFDPWRDRIWSHPRVAWWYAQNLLVFAREGSPAAATLPHAADATPLARVHPLCWLSGTLNLWRPYRAAARDEEPADYRAVRNAWAQGATTPPALAALARATANPDAPDRFPLTRTIIADPEAMLAAAETASAQAVAERDRLAGEIHTLRADIANLEADLAALTADRDRQTGEILALGAKISAANATNQLLEAANSTLRQQVAKQETHLAELFDRAQCAAAAGAERDAIRKELAAAHHLLTCMRESTSWRLTRPLRRLRGFRSP